MLTRSCLGSKLFPFDHGDWSGSGSSGYHNGFIFFILSALSLRKFIGSRRHFICVLHSLLALWVGSYSISLYVFGGNLERQTLRMSRIQFTVPLEYKGCYYSSVWNHFCMTLFKHFIHPLTLMCCSFLELSFGFLHITSSISLGYSIVLELNHFW